MIWEGARNLSCDRTMTYFENMTSKTGSLTTLVNEISFDAYCYLNFTGWGP